MRFRPVRPRRSAVFCFHHHHGGRGGRGASYGCAYRYLSSGSTRNWEVNRSRGRARCAAAAHKAKMRQRMYAVGRLLAVRERNHLHKFLSGQQFASYLHGRSGLRATANFIYFLQQPYSCTCSTQDISMY